MEAVNRIFLTNDLITISFLVGVILVFLMKVYSASDLYGYTMAFFINGFIEKRAEDSVSKFSIFYILLFFFMVVTVSITVLTLLSTFYVENDILIFSSVFLGVLIYFVVKQIINYSVVALFNLQKQLRYFLYAKNGYLYTVCLFLFPFLILNQYFLKNNEVLCFWIALLLVFRVVLIFINNKKLIFNNKFYFILYFCTLELAPLLILYKTIN